MQNSERSKMLGTMPMRSLVLKVSVPIMISMLVQALYNVVDSIFVARYDPTALTAVSLAYPFQMLMIALSTGMGVGINSLISRRLGEKRPGDARTAAWNGLLIECAGALLFVLVGFVLAPACMRLVVSDNLEGAENIENMGAMYLRIVCGFSEGLFLSILFERMLQATGNAMLSMATQLAGALTNIALDPIFIFGYFGLPAMGVRGAAIATVLGQFVSAGIGLALNQKKNEELRLRLPEFRVDGRTLREIVAVGLPSSVMASIGSVMNMGMNAILSAMAEANAAVNVLNVYFKLQSFVFMPVFGLGNGMIAVVGYNYGARLQKRVRDAVKVSLLYAMGIMLFGVLLFQVFPEALLSLFESDSNPELIAAMNHLGVTALRVISWHFPLAAVGITLSNVFPAVGKGVYSLILSVCRQLAVLLPVAWLLARLTGNVDMVWLSFLAAEVVSGVMAVLFYRRIDRKYIQRLGAPGQEART